MRTADPGARQARDQGEGAADAVEAAEDERLDVLAADLREVLLEQARVGASDLRLERSGRERSPSLSSTQPRTAWSSCASLLRWGWGTARAAYSLTSRCDCGGSSK